MKDGESYTVAEAKKRDLPVDLHLEAGAGGEPTWLLNRYREQSQMKMPGFTGNMLILMSPVFWRTGRAVLERDDWRRRPSGSAPAIGPPLRQ